MVKIHRRDVLGLAAGFIAQPLWSDGTMAAARTAPPANGPLSAGAVGELLKQRNVPGASVAVIEKGEIVAAYGFGLAREGRSVEPQTRFQVASLSKTINALGVLKLVQAGRIGLDDPINKHLKSWRIPDNELTAKTAVTVRMLLSHTGGTSVSGFRGYGHEQPVPSVLQVLDGRKPANSPAIRVVTLPGQEFAYSGGGTTVLQQMVMDVSGESYSEALQQFVLGPLGMQESEFRQTPPANAVEQAAFGHQSDGSPLPAGFRLYPEQAAAGLWSTPRDLAKVAIAIIRSHAGQRNSFLDKALTQAMLTPVQKQSGLGTFIDGAGNFLHRGSNGGYRALYSASPTSRRGFVAMTNGDGGEHVCNDLRQRVAKVHGWA